MPIFKMYGIQIILVFEFWYLNVRYQDLYRTGPFFHFLDSLVGHMIGHTRPFKIWTCKSLELRCFLILGVWYSDSYCNLFICRMSILEFRQFYFSGKIISTKIRGRMRRIFTNLDFQIRTRKCKFFSLALNIYFIHSLHCTVFFVFYFLKHFYLKWSNLAS